VAKAAGIFFANLNTVFVDNAIQKVKSIGKKAAEVDYASGLYLIEATQNNKE